MNDRYKSFSGIDFDANMEAVLQHLWRYVGAPETSNALWERFKDRFAKAKADNLPVADRLLLLHSHVYYIRELFEDRDDEAALAALHKLEDECF